MHEHPAGASSWDLPEIKELISMRAYLVQGPMCRWEMKLGDKLRGEYGVEEYVRKPTKWLTNSRRLAEILEGKCKNTEGDWHRHVRVMGGNRSQLAAIYPPKLVAAVLRGLKEQIKDDGMALDA